jgi:hypothetical protein
LSHLSCCRIDCITYCHKILSNGEVHEKLQLGMLLNSRSLIFTQLNFEPMFMIFHASVRERESELSLRGIYVSREWGIERERESRD